MSAAAVLTAPLVKCRCCGRLMDAQPQPSWRGDPLWIITCWASDCPMQKQTSTIDVYPSLDLSVYAIYALESLCTGDVFQWAGGGTCTVHYAAKSALWLQDEGYDGIYEYPFTASTDGVYVKRTGQRKADRRLIAQIEARAWRSCVGE